LNYLVTSAIRTDCADTLSDTYFRIALDIWNEGNFGEPVAAGNNPQNTPSLTRLDTAIEYVLRVDAKLIFQVE